MERNGISLDQLQATVDAVTAHPELAQFEFRSETQWVLGGRSETYIQSFYGVGQEDQSRTEKFTIVSDEPAVLLGTNAGPNAVELVLAALASCLSVGIAYNAAARGIQLQHLALTIKGTLDVQAFLGLSDAVRPGYESLQVQYHIESDGTRDQLSELLAHVQKTSPVLDVLRQPVPVTFIET
ncbi:MAG: OsmC family protein [Firmicutes bacterium]|jgi:uncharacterized OsmC-like protein|nr:OsmC family protein [Bacillota bacterium]